MSLPLPSPFTRVHAVAAGVSAYRLRRWLGDGLARRVLTGVYCDAELEDSIDLRVESVKLVSTPASVITDRTAAWLHGVDTFAYRELEILPPVETCVLPDATRVRRHGVRGRSREFVPLDLMQLSGVTLTTPLRTALDLGRLLRRREALAALDAFMRHHGVTRAQLRCEVERFTGRRGVVQLRQLILLARELSESPGESLTRLSLVDAGLPEPDLQYWIVVRGVPTFRLDLAYPAHRVAVEYDGQAFHDSPEQQARDQARRRWLREHGWTVIVVRREDLMSSGNQLWITQVAQALGLA